MDNDIKFYLDVTNIKTIYDYLIDKNIFTIEDLEDYLYLTELKELLIKYYYYGYDNMIDFIQKELENPSSNSDIKMRIIKTISYMYIDICDNQINYKINKTFHLNYNICSKNIISKYYTNCLKDLYLFYILKQKKEKKYLKIVSV
jgi:hypothetical protein